MPDGPAEFSRARRLLLFVFCLSGASGLLYEIAWMRRLTHTFGSTTLAVSTVLAAFMGGLALGSYLLGRVADRRAASALSLYGRLEIGIAALALAVPLFFRAASAIYLALHPSLEESPQIFFLLQFLLAALVLLLPTTLMGGTLPLVARFSVAAPEEVGGRVGALYAANTLGAAGGAAVATYWLLPGIGVWKTEVLAALLNLAAGFVALRLQKRLAPFAPEAPPPLAGSSTEASANARSGAGSVRPGLAILLVGIGLSGLAAMIYEVAWSRILAMVLGSSVYAFGMMVLVFLAGLALGSALFARLPGRAGRATFLFAVVLACNTVAGLVAIVLVPRLPVLFLSLFPLAKNAFFVLQLLQFLVAAALLFPSAVCFGFAFPAAIAATTESQQEIGLGVGRVSAVNTAGTVLGAFLGGFVLIPHAGLRATLMTAAACTAVAALGVLWLARSAARGWSRWVSLATGVALLVAALVPPWPREILAGGAGFFAASYQSPEEFLASTRQRELLFYKDGINTTLSVDREGPYRYYRSNGKTDASTNPHDLAVQVLLGQLPMLLHPNPLDVFDLGLGTGATAAAVARYPVRSIEIVDIEPAGREAVRFFEPENRSILSDPRVRFIAADGRNELLARRKTYEVIICDPSDIWVAGVANLFTREFYELARSRLKPGGIFVQWWHTHSLHPDHMKLVVATFRRVFPNAQYFRPSVGDVIMIGSVQPITWDYARLKNLIETVPGVAEDLRSIGLWHPLSVFAAFVLEGKDLERLVAGVREDHRDDLPVVEYAAPRMLYTDTTSANDAMVTGLQTKELPPLMGYEPSRDRDAQAVYLLGFGYASLERTEPAIRLMEESTRMDPANPKFWIGLGNQYRAKDWRSRAAEAYRRALAITPGDAEAACDLAQLVREEGDDGAAEEVLRAALAAAPQDASLLAAAAQLLAATGRVEQVVPLLAPALPKNPKNPALHLLMGQALAATGHGEEALPELQTACELAPDDADVQRAAGKALLAAGDARAAAQACVRSETLDPSNAETLTTLEEALRLLGDHSGASAAHERAARLAPSQRR